MLGEAVVFLRPELARDFLFLRKQAMQLASKMRFLAAQFAALLGGDLWLRSAAHANAMAPRLAEASAASTALEIAHPVQANAVFASARPAIERCAQRSRRAPLLRLGRAPARVRWMCSWDTTEDDVDGFARALAAALS